MLVKTLALVAGSLIGEAQTCTIPNRFIQGNLHFMQYIIERAGTKAGFGGALISLDQLRAVDRVDHRYLGAVHKAVGFGPVCRG